MAFFFNFTSGVILFLLSIQGLLAGEKIYNGIVLPDTWPPNRGETLDNEYQDPPYLISPPTEINISTGRQLFVDNFLIEKTDCELKYHLPKYSNQNPILGATEPWEMNHGITGGMPFSDGLWYDPLDSLYKMWYFVGNFEENKGSTALAYSSNGIKWEKPNFGVYKKTNIVRLEARDASTTWLNYDERDLSKRFVHLVTVEPNYKNHALYYSKDGIDWGNRVKLSAPIRDRSTLFYNPFRKVWVMSIKEAAPRRRYYRESKSLDNLFDWSKNNKVIWQVADGKDNLPPTTAPFPELYNLDCIAYESIMVGLFTIWSGNSKDQNDNKHNSVHIGFSRDGFHFNRFPDRLNPFLPDTRKRNNREGWHYKNIQSVGGGMVLNKDSLRFYFSMRDESEIFTGLATLRRDGFASLHSGGEKKTVITKPFKYTGQYLFINADSDQGEIRVEILNEFGDVIEPYSYGYSLPILHDNTMQKVKWENGDLLENLPKKIKLKFHIQNADLYSFWITTNEYGASYGYVAGGGPGFKKNYDDTGILNKFQNITLQKYSSDINVPFNISVFNLKGKRLKSIKLNQTQYLAGIDNKIFKLPFGHYFIIGQINGHLVFSKKILINGNDSNTLLKLWK